MAVSYRNLSPLMTKKQKGQHQQVFGEGADDRDIILAGVDFNVKYIGSTVVPGEKGKGCEATEPAVRKVYDELKRRRSDPKNLKRRIMVVSAENIMISEPSGGESVASFPIGKISFCNVSKKIQKTIAFIAKDKPDDPFKAFVFQCESQPKTSELFQAVSKAFMVHFETFQAAKMRNPWATRQSETTPSEKERIRSGGSPRSKDDSGIRDRTTTDQWSTTLNSSVTGVKEPAPVDFNGVPFPDLPPFKNPSLQRVKGDFVRRQRSVTDPPPYQPPVVPPLMEFNSTSLSNKTLSTPDLNDEFDQEFTKLAETRLSRCASGPVGTKLEDDWSGWTSAP